MIIFSASLAIAFSGILGFDVWGSGMEDSDAGREVWGIDEDEVASFDSWGSLTAGDGWAG